MERASAQVVTLVGVSAASSQLQRRSRAAHFTAKASLAGPVPGSACRVLPGCGGRHVRRVWFGREALLRSLVSHDQSYKPMVKSIGAQRESDVVVYRRSAGDRTRRAGRAPTLIMSVKRVGHGMSGFARSNHPGRPGSADAEVFGYPSPAKVREHQRRLWAAAKQSSGRRFHALYDRIYRGDVLCEAWERVRANRGAAGVDRVTLAAAEDYGVDRMLRALRDGLRAGT
jgi:hypothetical protein